MEYATMVLDPMYGDWLLTDGKDHPYSDTKKLNDLAEKGWRVIGSHYIEKSGYSQMEWHLLLEHDNA